MMNGDGWHRLEINGGKVRHGMTTRLVLPAGVTGYADAQIDDYSLTKTYRHSPGKIMTLRARFSHPAEQLQGTAGFGFWNAPYGDPSSRRLSLPRAAWFFFASGPNDLPFAPGYPGRGWFAATINTGAATVLGLIPLAPFALVLNQFQTSRQRVWPAIKAGLGIHHAALPIDITAWHEYSLFWRREGCRFEVDGVGILDTSTCPRGPLGFVCWLDNQYLIASPRGRIRAGVLPIHEEQWLEVSDLRLAGH